MPEFEIVDNEVWVLELAVVDDEVWVILGTVVVLPFNVEVKYNPTRSAITIMGMNPTAAANALFAFFFFNWDSLLNALQMNESEMRYLILRNVKSVLSVRTPHAKLTCSSIRDFHENSERIGRWLEVRCFSFFNFERTLTQK